MADSTLGVGVLCTFLEGHVTRAIVLECWVALRTTMVVAEVPVTCEATLTYERRRYDSSCCNPG